MAAADEELGFFLGFGIGNSVTDDDSLFESWVAY
jgi:hypothetical protein